MNHFLIPLGIIFVFIGIVIIIIGTILSSQGKSNSQFAVGGIIGFIPFGFGTSKELVYFAVAVSVILLIIFLVFGLRLIR